MWSSHTCFPTNARVTLYHVGTASHFIVPSSQVIRNVVMKDFRYEKFLKIVVSQHMGT